MAFLSQLQTGWCRRPLFGFEAVHVGAAESQHTLLTCRRTQFMLGGGPPVLFIPSINHDSICTALQQSISAYYV